MHMLEFKVGEKSVTTTARNQAWEYALDTKNFHEPSHALPIIPVLIPTEYQTDALPPLRFATDSVCEPIAIGPDLLPQLLDDLWAAYPTPLDATAWIAGRYKPTPTIIEAARRVKSLIERARTQGEKIIHLRHRRDQRFSAWETAPCLA